jgi:predicted nucleotidyltransferase
MSMERGPVIDPQTAHAVRVFLERIADDYPLVGARLYGSRARGDHDESSDADLAVLLKGPQGNRTHTSIEMAGVAFDVMLDTEVLISPLPIWEEEWDHPQSYSNPRLLENIRREGIAY